jgi:hypothetical protein
MGPLDANDLFYHIPRLEDGHKTSCDFRELLKTTGYADFKHSLFRTKFWTVYLPRLLHRDVWEKITGKLVKYPLQFYSNQLSRIRTPPLRA